MSRSIKAGIPLPMNASTPSLGFNHILTHLLEERSWYDITEFVFVRTESNSLADLHRDRK
jgi:hypothetical protein